MRYGKDTQNSEIHMTVPASRRLLSLMLSVTVLLAPSCAVRAEPTSATVMASIGGAPDEGGAPPVANKGGSVETAPESTTANAAG
jgi:hypothetical protein